MNDLSAIASEARGLMNAHGLGHWVFQWDRAVRRMGCCNYRKRTISVSEVLAQRTPLSEVRDTILHEIAHAIAGPQAGHGLAWRSVALRIGCNGKRCYDASAVEPVPGKWQAVCGGCGKVFHKHRMTAAARQRTRYHRPCGPEKGALKFFATR
jgi:predicted SprT family Zn-dependent metalloprotease